LSWCGGAQNPDFSFFSSRLPRNTSPIWYKAAASQHQRYAAERQQYSHRAIIATEEVLSAPQLLCTGGEALVMLGIDENSIPS
jgi:hypothetical protein